MVPYQVARLKYGASYFRTTADKVANQKEDGADLMLSQEVEQLQGVGIVGAVIEGKCDLVPITASDARSGRRPARWEPARGIGISPNRETGNQARGNHFGIHASRV